MKTTLPALLLSLLLGLACAVRAQPRFDFDSTPGRLPKTVLAPRHALALTLDPAADTFSGESRIMLQVRRPVASIVLHANGLAAGNAALGARTMALTADDKAQTWTLTPTDGVPIAAGEHMLVVAYTGKVRADGTGLYRAPHQAFGKPVQMLATQLEAIFARMVFPTFDEPAFRTVFEISVRAPQDFEVVSNMPETQTVAEGATVLHRFAPTPAMPSYLVAVAVGRFDALTGSADGVPLRILTAPGKRNQAGYALAATQRLLPYYSDYFGLPYALPKLDQLAVPSTRRGAMEDWGLISYAENVLLFDPATSDGETRRNIFVLVAHEVAHQWFGNLVTAASWEEIWLNEAFATWMAEKATDRFNPEWQTALRRRKNIDWTMGRDASPATRAIRSGAVSEDRVFDVFDGITYTKGGAVLSMLELWLGEAAFQRGLAGYMQARRGSNATAGDLWFHIGRASGRDAAAVAASWTDQPGFPLVSVDSRCESGQTRLDVTQQQFSTSGAAGRAVWQVPLVLRHGGATSSVLLTQASQSFTLPGCPALPTLVNPGGEGFYRVAYAPAQQAALAAAFATLPAAAQVTLLSDSFALAQAGRLPMAAYLELLGSVPQARGTGRPALFAQARSGVLFLARAFDGTAAEAALAAVARQLFAPELAALGWMPRAGEDSEVEVLRGTLITDLARYDDTATVTQAQRLFDADQDGSAPLPPAIRAAVIRAVGRHADPARFGQLMARLKAAAGEEDRWLFAEALAQVSDPALVSQVLELSLHGGLPTNIAAALPGMVGGAQRHGEAAYNFVLANWKALTELASQRERTWLLPEAAKGFSDRGKAARLLADQQRLLGALGGAPAAQVAARIELMAAVKAREAERVVVPLAALQRRLAGLKSTKGEGGPTALGSFDSSPPDSGPSTSQFGQWTFRLEVLLFHGAWM